MSERNTRGRGRNTNYKRKNDNYEDRDTKRTRSNEIDTDLLNLLPITNDLLDIIESRARNAEADHGRHRESRDVFIGNLPPNINGNDVSDFITTAMELIGLIRKGDNIINECRLKGTFCFLEFRTHADCSRALNLNGISYKGNILKVVRPSKYTGPATPSLNWNTIARYANNNNPTTTIATINATGNQDKPRKIPQIDRDTKPYREIFLGNLSPEIPVMDLREYLGSALRKLGLSYSGDENPIHMVTNNGKYGFIETRTAIDTANLLNLNNIPFFGINIKISRPSKFIGALPNIRYFNYNELINKYHNGELKLMTSGIPSCIIVILNMLTSIEINNPSIYMNSIDDTRNECNLFGAVKQVIIPRTITNNNHNYIGRVFVEMGNIEFARNCILGMKGRSYNGKIVDIKFYPEHLFRSMNYSYHYPDTVITASDGPVPMSRVLEPDAVAKIERVPNYI